MDLSSKRLAMSTRESWEDANLLSSPCSVAVSVSMPSHQTCIGQEEANKLASVGLVVCGDSNSHKDPDRQSLECGNRIRTIRKRLKETACLAPGLVVLTETPRVATDEELVTLHTKSYLRKLEQMCNITCKGGDLPDDNLINEKAHDCFDSVYMNQASLQAARESAGCALECVDAVCEGRVQAAAAAIRPPGHHAEAHTAMGFCFFNNAALVARRAVDRYGMEKVLIVDFDIHHGNGTQRMFWEDDQVVYFSVHRWDNGVFYPGAKIESCPSTTGPSDGPGAGKTINVGLSGGEMGDLEYRAVWSAILLPIVNELDPDLIVYSAGFDAADKDPVGHYRVSSSCFGAMIQSVSKQAPNARAVLLLEGGYNASVTADCFRECVRALQTPADSPVTWPDVSQWPQVKKAALLAINQTIEHQRPYWTSLRSVVL